MKDNPVKRAEEKASGFSFIENKAGQKHGGIDCRLGILL